MAAFAVFGLSNVNAQEDFNNFETFGFNHTDIMLEGSLGYNTSRDKNTDTKTNNFNFNPKVGYFVADNVAIGLEAGYNSFKKEVAGVNTRDAYALEAGVFARYYFLELGKRFKTYTELGVGFGSQKDKIGDIKAKGFGAGLDLGINYFVTENIAISFGLANVLSYQHYKADGAETESSFNADVNVFNNFFETAQFGLMFKL